MRMKRMGFCGFKQFDVGRKMALCLRFGIVGNTNGDVIENCRDHQMNADLKCSNDDSKKENCECQRNKGNFFKTIRKKWRRHKRSKRCENRKRTDPVLNVCRTPEEMHSNCPKHQRLKCDGNSQVKRIPSTAYLSNNISASTENEIENNHVDVKLASVDNLDCSCFGSPSRKTFDCATGKATKFKACASRSMSDISSVAPISPSSPTLKTDSEINICQLSTITNSPLSPNEVNYCNDMCLDIQETVDSSFAQERIDPLQPSQKFGNLTQELYKLSKYGWYWGPISRSEAESKLVDQQDGAFLVRDSSDDRYILSLSFRSYGKTLHTRIEHTSGLFSFYSQPEPEGHASIVELIQQSMCYSQSGVFCYSRSRSPGSPSYPVRLTKPISRFTQVRSLQYLCRFVIRQYTRFDHIQKLPLPQRIKGYLEEGHY